MNKEDFCRQNPDKCRFPSDIQSQEDMQYQQPPQQYRAENYMQGEQKTMTAPEGSTFNQPPPSFQGTTDQKPLQ